MWDSVFTLSQAKTSVFQKIMKNNLSFYQLNYDQRSKTIESLTCKHNYSKKSTQKIG